MDCVLSGSLLVVFSLFCYAMCVFFEQINSLSLGNEIASPSPYVFSVDQLLTIDATRAVVELPTPVAGGWPRTCWLVGPASETQDRWNSPAMFLTMWRLIYHRNAVEIQPVWSTMLTSVTYSRSSVTTELSTARSRSRVCTLKWQLSSRYSWCALTTVIRSNARQLFVDTYTLLSSTLTYTSTNTAHVPLICNRDSLTLSCAN